MLTPSHERSARWLYWGAAFVRFPLALSDVGAGMFMLGATDALILVCVLIDWVKSRRLHPAFVLAVGLVAVCQIAAVLFAPTLSWSLALAWLTRHILGSF